MRLFGRERFTFDLKRLAVIFPPRNVTHLTVTSPDPLDWALFSQMGGPLPADADRVMIDEAAFRDRCTARMKDPDPRESFRQGDWIESYIQVRLASGEALFFETRRKIHHQVDELENLHRLMKANTLLTRIDGGGLCMINSKTLMRAAAFPGLPVSPVEAWSVEQIVHQED